MMNPLQIMQMLRGGNPQETIINEMKKSVGNNPVMQNALDMAEKHDSKGLENLARNLGKSNGVDVDQMVNQIKSQFGMK